MPESTTEALQELLDRFCAGDTEAKKSLVGAADERLLILTRKHLRSFSKIHQEEETTAIWHSTFEKRFNDALDAVRPATVRMFFGLAGKHIRLLLLDMAREGKRAKEPRPGAVLDSGVQAAGAQ